MKLRPYQQLIKTEVIDRFKTNDLSVCATSMGGGKSIIISEIARHYSEKDKPVVILTNLTELIPQLAEHLDEFNLKYGIIKSGHELDHIGKDKNIKIWLIMEQSFHEKKRKQIDIDCFILIKDEYHIGKGKKRYEDIYNSLKPEKVFGLSGTPVDEKGYLLEGISEEDLILHGNAQELTELGFLVPLKYYVSKWSEDKDYSKVKLSGADYSNTELEKKINTMEHTDLIVYSMNELKGKSLKTLVYANSIKHANRITKALKKDGYKVVAIHSEETAESNKENIANFSLPKTDKNTVDCLVSVSKLTTGFNEPAAEFLVLCRPTKILRLYLQILFRVARPSKKTNKKFGIVLDLAQCISTHGFGIENRKFIKRGDRKALTKEKKKFERKVVKDMLGNKTKEITRQGLELKMKEVRIKSHNIKEMKINELANLFNSTMDIQTVVEISFEINWRSNRVKYESNEVIDIINVLENKNNNLDLSKKIIFLKTLKQDIKTIVREKSALTALVSQ